MSTNADVLEKQELKEISKEPPMFNVILLNDNYTSMEFVLEILVDVFRKPEHEANQLMLDIHISGKGIAGVYTKEVALTKQDKVLKLAEINEFPLQCILEEENPKPKNNALKF